MKTEKEFEDAVFSAVRKKKSRIRKIKSGIITGCVCFAVCLSVGIVAFPKIAKQNIVSENAPTVQKPSNDDAASDVVQDDSVQSDVTDTHTTADKNENTAKPGGAQKPGQAQDSQQKSESSSGGSAKPEDSFDKQENSGAADDVSGDAADDVTTDNFVPGDVTADTQSALILSSDQPSDAARVYELVFGKQPKDGIISFEMASVDAKEAKFIFRFGDGEDEVTTVSDARDIIVKVKRLSSVKGG